MEVAITKKTTYSTRPRRSGGCRRCYVKQTKQKFFKRTTLIIATQTKRIHCQKCQTAVITEPIEDEARREFFQTISHLKLDKREVRNFIVTEEYGEEGEDLEEMDKNKNDKNTQTEGSITMEESPLFQSELTEEEIHKILEEACNQPGQIENDAEENVDELLRTLEADVLEPIPMESDEEVINQIYMDLLKEMDEVDNGNKYASEPERIASFNGWRCEYFSPQEMAAAGFYYTGEIDKVRCFTCQTEICRWESSDNPIEEHRRWGGRCMFLQQHVNGNNPVMNGQDTCGIYSEGVKASRISEKNTENVNEKLQCKICWAQEVEIVLLPCGHAICCAQCAEALKKCAICRGDIEGKIRTFF